LCCQLARKNRIMLARCSVVVVVVFVVDVAIDAVIGHLNLIALTVI